MSEGTGERSGESSGRPEVDVGRANPARIYDYFLGGGHNFAVDRRQAAMLLDANPDLVSIAQANRAYLGRVVRWCRERGIDQFLDLGSGVPTVGNVHEIAHRTDPSSRVAYVDVEPVAAAACAELVADLPTVTSTRADIRDPDAVISAPGVAELLDFARPVAVLAVACLHFVSGDLAPMMERYRGRLGRDSVVALSHASDDVDDAEVAERMRSARAAHRGSAAQATMRSRAEIRSLLGDVELVDPGVVDIVRWRPDTDRDARLTGVYAAVGVIRGR